jgi:hypothetical protein
MVTPKKQQDRFVPVFYGLNVEIAVRVVRKPLVARLGHCGDPCRLARQVKKFCG